MSEIRVTNIIGENGLDAVNFSKGVSAAGIVTATTFSGSFTGSGANITALNAGNVSSGTLATTRGGTGRADAQRLAGAWCTYQSDGTPSIYDSYNCSSVTDNSEGAQTVNFTTACANTNYSVAGTATYPSGTNNHFITLGSYGGGMNQASIGTGSCRIYINYINSSAQQDVRRVTTMFFGDWP